MPSKKIYPVKISFLSDHPKGLAILFFTELWERFSYYGMRAILVLFLTSSILNDGWGWERDDALILYGWYTGLVYFTPLIGGILADKYFGYRVATVSYTHLTLPTKA